MALLFFKYYYTFSNTFSLFIQDTQCNPNQDSTQHEYYIDEYINPSYRITVITFIDLAYYIILMNMCVSEFLISH